MLILVRHGERASLASSAGGEPGLSPRGELQAAALAVALTAELGAAPPVLFSSPALRCIRTVAPLGKQLGIQPVVSEELSESHYGESPEQFVERCTLFFDRWQQTPDQVVIACSHHDWIGEVSRAALGQAMWLDPADSIAIEPSASGFTVLFRHSGML